MSLSDLVKLCALDDVPDGGALRVETPGFPALAVFRVGDLVYVTDDVCTHGEASLSEGDLEGCEIICPYHLGSFDITSGKPIAAPCTEAIRIYAPIVDAGMIFIVPEQ